MYSLSLISYKLSLALHILLFSWKLLKIKLGKHRLWLVVVAVITAVVLHISLFTLPYSEEPLVRTLPVIVPTNSNLYVEKQLTEAEIIDELTYWLRILESQPSHRDVLINISQLYRVLGEESQAIYYWEQARKADPSNDLFK